VALHRTFRRDHRSRRSGRGHGLSRLIIIDSPGREKQAGESNPSVHNQGRHSEGVAASTICVALAS